MRAQPPKKNHKKTAIICIALLILAAGVSILYIVYMNRATDTNTTNTQSGEAPLTPPPSNSSDSKELPTKVEDKTPVQFEDNNTDAEEATPSEDNERFRIPETE